eukprot:m.244131 g.244131  ORF g.244131 m.244131 type:complete len:651 (+) comp15351_c0_seq3:3786-5738(+)
MAEPALEPEALQRLVSQSEFDTATTVIWPQIGLGPDSPIYNVWFRQSFGLTPVDSYNCFFLQLKNGPCGVLAAVQGFLICELLWPSDGSAAVDPSQATIAQCNASLCRAWTSVLCRAAGDNPVALMMPNGATGAMHPAQLLAEGLTLHTLQSREAVLDTVTAALEHVSGHGGLVLLLYSLVLTRGADSVRAEFSGTTSLIDVDGFCDQCLVNMLLTGIARYGVDDDTWADWEGMTQVGFLTAQEEYQINPKFLNPAYPVWVLHGGGHYTVVFSSHAEILSIIPPIATSVKAMDTSPDDNGGPGSASVGATAPQLAIAATPANVGAGSAPSTAVAAADGDDDDDDELAAALRLSMETHTAQVNLNQPAAAPSARADAMDRAPDSNNSPPKRPRSNSAGANGPGAVDFAAMTYDEQMALAVQQSLDDALIASTAPTAAETQVESTGDPELDRVLQESMKTFQQEAGGDNHPSFGIAYRVTHCNGLNLARPSIRVQTFDLYPVGGMHSAQHVDEAVEEANRARRIRRILGKKTVTDATGAQVVLYNVVCMADGSMEKGGKPPPGEKWRCRDCHLQNPPVWQAFNDPEQEICRQCFVAVEQCGYCHWLPKSLIPQADMRQFEREQASDILLALRRRWRQAEIDTHDQPAPLLSG